MRFSLNPLCGNEAGLSCPDSFIVYSVNSIKNEIRPNGAKARVLFLVIEAISKHYSWNIVRGGILYIGI